MRNILIEFGYFLFYISTFFIKNKFGIEASKNLEYYRCMKHLDLSELKIVDLNYFLFHSYFYYLFSYLELRVID